MNLNQFCNHITMPALEMINSWSIEAEQLVMSTIAAESNFEHIKQIGNGPARGLLQMEVATHNDIWSNFLPSKPGLITDLNNMLMRGVDLEDQLFSNLYYQVAMCRIHYMRFPERLPSEGDWSAMASYWKRYYNTEQGAGTVEGFLQKALPVIEIYG